MGEWSEPERESRDGEGAEAESRAAESRAFLEAVRRVAGFRVSPREAAAAADAVEAAGETPSPERVAALVSASRGDRSQRQRRHAELWRALGAELAVRGEPAGPDAQRAFIGEARAAARREVSDALLLRVAVEVAGAEAPLTPRLVGTVTRRVVSRGGRWLGEDELAAATREAIPGALQALAEAEPGPEAPPPERRPERPRWRPSPPPARPKVRRKRRAKPAGRSRKRKA